MTFFVLFILGFSYVDAQVRDTNQTDPNKLEIILPSDILRDVKIYLPDAKLIKIEALDKDSHVYNAKAIQSFDDTSILDGKAIVNGEYLPIKLIVKDDNFYYPLKAITKDVIFLDIKAIEEGGELLPV
jgi:hypothetical protein